MLTLKGSTIVAEAIQEKVDALNRPYNPLAGQT